MTQAVRRSCKNHVRIPMFYSIIFFGVGSKMQKNDSLLQISIHYIIIEQNMITDHRYLICFSNKSFNECFHQHLWKGVISIMSMILQ